MKHRNKLRNFKTRTCYQNHLVQQRFHRKQRCPCTVVLWMCPRLERTINSKILSWLSVMTGVATLKKNERPVASAQIVGDRQPTPLICALLVAVAATSQTGSLQRRPQRHVRSVRARVPGCPLCAIGLFRCNCILVFVFVMSSWYIIPKNVIDSVVTGGKQGHNRSRSVLGNSNFYEHCLLSYLSISCF